MKVKATVHGAISIVNAIATGKGATLGTSLKVEALLESQKGKGITIYSEKNENISSKLINKTVEKIVPKKELERTKLWINLTSQVPTGYGLKSSSAISTSVALACSKIFNPSISDKKILLAGVEASIETRVSITGAYDDACACYYGGFNVTDNYKKKIIHSENAPNDLIAVIFIPRSRHRGNVRKLHLLRSIFEQAWNLAKRSEYWDAMTLNGLATSAILSSHPKILSELLDNGALAASISGNGPAIAAVSKKENITKMKNVFDSYDGNILTSKINNSKAEVHEL